MFKVLISKDANLDFKEASEHYGMISLELKKKFRENFYSTIEQLKQIPHFQIRYDDFRMRQVKGFPVMIHYILDHEIIKIYGVRFAQQNPKNYPKT